MFWTAHVSQPLNWTLWTASCEYFLALWTHIMKWFEAGFVPKDCNFNNVGRTQEGTWVTLDFDLFERIQPKDHVKSKFWQIFKKALNNFANHVVPCRDPSWARLLAMLVNPSQFWFRTIGPDSALWYNEDWKPECLATEQDQCILVKDVVCNSR